MAVSLSPAERRAEKVAAILATSASWVTVDIDGAEIHLIPSATDSRTIYEVDERGCSCPDFLRRLERGPAAPCKHMDALHIVLNRQLEQGPRDVAECDGPIVDPFAITEPERCPACGRTELRGDCWRCYQVIRGYRVA
jgi:predicted nucleic acid-binding Zn finger protein